MKKTNNLIAILSCFLFLQSVETNAQKVTVEDVVYKLEKNDSSYNVFVYSLPKKVKEVKIVGMIEYNGKKYPVRGSYNGWSGNILNDKYIVNAFRPDNAPMLETVSMDEQFTEVPRNMFSQATQIKRINLPSTIVTIKENAFEGCTSLESIVIPKSVKSIERFAFYNCKSLSSVSGIRPDISYGSDAFGRTAYKFTKYTSSFSYFSYNYIYENTSVH